MKKVPLGAVPIQQDAFENELAIAELYQSFSQELLRLALLGIAGIGFLLVELGTDDQPFPVLLGVVRIWLYFSLGAFGLSAAAALVHRYCASDGLAYHLEFLRRVQRAHGSDFYKARAQQAERRRRWRVSGHAMWISAASLAFGAIFLAVTFGTAIAGCGSQ